MNTSKKRRPDGRAIRETKTYTVRDLSVAARKSEETVREWIKQGLPTIDEQTPTMIYGHSAKAWLDEKWAGRRHKIAMGELYCCGCQQARAPVAQTIRFKRLASGAMNVQAQCSICGALMNRCIKIDDLAAFQAAAMTQAGEVERFIESHTSSSNPDSSTATPAVGKEARESNGNRPRRAMALPCNPRNERLKHAFFEFCHNVEGRAERSIRTDEVALLRFESHFGFRDFGSLSKDEAIAFKNHLRESDLTIPVIVATLSVVNKFLGWLSTRPGYGRKVAARDYLNLTAKERRSAGAIEKIVPSPSPDDVDQAIRKMPAESFIDKRNRAMMALLGLTAIRSTALTTLRLKHVDLDEGVLHQRSTEVETKFSKNILTVLVPLKPGWLAILADYIAWLRSQGFSDNDPLFPKVNIEGGHGVRFGRRYLSRQFMADAQMIERTVKKAFAAAGLRQYTPHSFRHMHAKLADDVTASVGLARAMSSNLGHSTPKVTYASYGTQAPEQRRDLIRGHFQQGRKLLPDSPSRAELRAVFHALKPIFDKPSD